MTTLTLGYWDIRGLAEPIRMLLHYVQVPFEDVRYSFQSGQVFPTKEEWHKVKNNFELDFPNLPYLIDGDLKLTQSLAILKYLARKHKLIGDEPAKIAIEEMLESQIVDIRGKMVTTIFYKSHLTDQEFENEMDLLRQSFASSLADLERWIGDKKWLAYADKLSYVDFMAYEYLDYYRVFIQSDCFAKFPKMTAFMKRFEELPSLKEYVASAEHRNAGCFSPFGKLQLGYRFNSD